jgi:hypothetical protein
MEKILTSISFVSLKLYPYIYMYHHGAFFLMIQMPLGSRQKLNVSDRYMASGCGGVP